MALPTIGTLWIGGELSWLEQLCLQSFLDHGHDVVLYSYDAVQGVPDGVRHADANDILPAEKIIRHARTGSPAYHADLFRLRMIAREGHVWADTDAYCCQPWKLRRGAHFHGWISDDKPMVNNGVLGLPKSSRTLRRMLEFTADEYPTPPWLPEAEQARLAELKARGEGVHVSLLPWGVWGPDALTWFLKETGEIARARPGHVLYPVPFAMAGVTLNPARIRKARRLIREDTLSIHFWGRRFRNIAARHGGLPPAGSLVDELLKKHGIRPERTMHLMQKPPAVAPARDVDFSMLTTRDVANIILQRSEIGPVGEEIRQWLAGNDAPLLAYAEKHREEVLSEALEAARRACGEFVGAVDAQRPARIADIGCGYAFADLFLHRRWGSGIVLIDIEESEARHFGFAEEGAGYASLERARAFLQANGVPADAITVVNPRRDDVSQVGPVDLAISLISCGFHYPASTYEDFFRQNVSPGGAIVLDIRKGSGGIGFMKGIGAVEVLKKHAKHSVVLTRLPGARAAGKGESGEEGA